jgi:hypothetical protein
MKIEIKNDILIVACDNLDEFFTQFKEYRSSKNIREVATKENFRSYVGTIFGFWKIHKKIVPIESGKSVVTDKISSAAIEIYEPYSNGKTKYKIELALSLPDLKEEEWNNYSEKITEVIKEIWENGEVHNYQNLDLNWPVANQNNNWEKIKILEKENERLKKQLKKETENKNVWMIVSISTIIILFLSILFYLFKRPSKSKK